MLYSAKQGNKQTRTPIDCLSPQHNHHRMAHLGDVEPFVTMSSPFGMVLNLCYVTETGRIEHSTTIDIAPDVRVHFCLSALPEWYYVITMDAYHNRLSCTCNRADCPHIADVERRAKR